MSGARPVDILCPACGREALLLRAPRYEGLKKTGEELTCSACGHAFADEAAVPFRAAPRAEVFTEADRSVVVDPFARDERGRLCRYCAHYVVNPFLQWCARHQREVQATDICGEFEPKRETGKPEPF